MSLDNLSLSLERNAIVIDTAGGEANNWGVVATDLPATLNRKHRVEELRKEEIGHGGGPGVVTRKDLFVTLHLEDYPDGYPQILVNDRFFKPDAVLARDGRHTPGYLVMFVRDTYDESLQIDVELVL